MHGIGAKAAPSVDDVARTIEELEVWKLACALKVQIYALTDIGTAATDWRFRDQLRDAGASMTRNIAEGFGRYRHREFANFLFFARGSVDEVADELRDGVLRRHWRDSEIREALVLCKRTRSGITRLIDYLRNNPDRW